MYEWKVPNGEEAVEIMATAMRVQFRMDQDHARSISTSAILKLITRRVGVYQVACVDEITLTISEEI
jgi:hypothetical protein